MASHDVLRTVATISTVSSLVQGLTWSFLSLLAVLSYGCHLTAMSFGTKGDITEFFVAYFQGSSCQTPASSFYGPVITSADRLVLLQVLVLVFNLLLTIASITTIIALAGKKAHVINGWLIFYLATGFCVAILDAIVSWPFAEDLHTISISQDITSKQSAELALLLLFLISTRFFIFWGLNVSLLIGLTVCLVSNVNCGEEVVPNTQEVIYQRRKSTPTFREAVKCSVCNKPPSFQFDSNDLDKAAEFRATEYPPYTAFSRWPQLHPNSRASRPASSPEMTSPSPVQQEPLASNNRYQPQRQLQQRHSELQQQQQQLQQNLRKRSPETSYPEPPRPPPLRNQVTAPVAVTPAGGRNQQGQVRPNSLQEAILTVRPLRRTRPGIASQ